MFSDNEPEWERVCDQDASQSPDEVSAEPKEPASEDCHIQTTTEGEEVKAADTTQQPASAPQVEATPETPAIKDNSIYERFKDKFGPSFEDESELARSLREADNVELFLSGVCSRFHVLCGRLACSDCMMRSSEPRELRKEWLEYKGFIQPEQPEDSSNTAAAEVSTIDALCAAASVLKQHIHDAVGYTATPEDIIEFLREYDPTKDELYALIATEICS